MSILQYPQGDVPRGGLRHHIVIMTTRLELVADGRYEVIALVQGHVGRDKILLGEAGVCRYCGNTDKNEFRNIAHTFPEALGNKWIFSRHECDRCNALFGIYDDALAKSVGAILTIGGVKGKNNKVRSTGRSARGPSIRHSKQERRRLSVVLETDDPSALVKTVDSRFSAVLQVPIERFIPRHAYKALIKSAIALMPDEELGNYVQLRNWLQHPSDALPFHCLPVGLSFGSVGNSPPNAAGTLLRRTNDRDHVPHLIFILCIGSVCLQLDLMADKLDDHIPFIPIDAIQLEWTSIISGDDGEDQIRIPYGKPIHLNWASRELSLQPIEQIKFEMCLSSNVGHFAPIVRADP